MNNKEFTFEKPVFGFHNDKINFKRPYEEKKDNSIIRNKQQQDLIALVRNLFFED